MKKNTLQKIRISFITVSAVLFPFTFYYLSPAIPLGGAAYGIVTGSLIIFAALFLISIFMGRVFCSWLCPAGGIQDQLATGRTKRVAVKRISRIKFIVWGIWLAGLLYLFRESGGVKGISFAYATEYGLSVTSVQALFIYGIVVSVFILLPLVFGRRTACHTICWISPFMIIGRKIGACMPVPFLHLKTNPESCIGCGRCDKVCPMSLDVRKLVGKGIIIDSDCILCGKCSQTCERDSIEWSWKKQKSTAET